MRLSVWWLNALIVTATVTLWLMLLGSAITAIAFAASGDSSSGGGGIDVPELTNTGDVYLDSTNNSCLAIEVDDYGNCPSSPYYNP